mmetsp:Transcript_32118/g.80815  ORF Transcript_32118/g.80815 Transcript_32118/m.80815 type:complete len:500 (+) Transcript_32118:3-1502(+)
MALGSTSPPPQPLSYTPMSPSSAIPVSPVVQTLSPSRASWPREVVPVTQQPVSAGAIQVLEMIQAPPQVVEVIQAPPSGPPIHVTPIAMSQPVVVAQGPPRQIEVIQAPPQEPIKERIFETERVVEVPVEKIVYQEKEVQVPVFKETIKEVQVPVYKEIEIVKEVTVEVPVEVEKIVIQEREVEVEKLVEVERIVEVEKIVYQEVPVDRVVEVPVDRIVEVPVEVVREVERIVHIPSPPPADVETVAAERARVLSVDERQSTALRPSGEPLKYRTGIAPEVMMEPQEVTGLVGLGVRITQDHSRGSLYFIDEVIPGYAASRSGQVTVGDEVLKIDGRDIPSIGEIKHLTQGAVGTAASMELKRGSRAPYKVQMTRCFPDGDYRASLGDNRASFSPNRGSYSTPNRGVSNPAVPYNGDRTYSPTQYRTSEQMRMSGSPDTDTYHRKAYPGYRDPQGNFAKGAPPEEWYGASPPKAGSEGFRGKDFYEDFRPSEGSQNAYI